MGRPSRVVACVLLAWLNAPALSAETPESTRFTTDAERTVPGFLERYEVPTVEVAVVEGSVVTSNRRFDDGSGEAKQGDVFEVASLSKTATALAVLSLAEKGRLDLDAPVDEYLGRWHVPRSRYDESRVTARRLLSHTAGFPFSGVVDRAKGIGRYPEIENVLAGREGLRAAKLETEPGSGFTYSNPGYGVLELLVEEVTGQTESFPSAMRELVFDPLGMTDTGFQDDEDLLERVVPGFHRAGKPSGPFLRLPRAAGGMLATAPDVARLLTATMYPRNQGGLLSARSLEEMRKLPKAAVGAFGLGDDGGYALGVARVQLPSGSFFVANFGSHEGYNSFILGLPRKRAGLVVLTNSGSGLGVELELALKWFDLVAGERPGFFAGRLRWLRSIMRFATLALLLLSIGYVALVTRRVRDGRRRWPGRVRLRPLLTKTLPLVVLSLGLFTLFDTGLVTGQLGGIAPARFISGDYQWLIGGLALALGAIGVAGTAVPKLSSEK